MTKLNIPLPGRDYDILIEPGLLDQAGAHCRTVLPRAKKLAVVTDTNVAPLYAARAEKSLAAAGFAVRIITIPAGETSKSMQMLEFLYDEFMAFGLTRTDAVPPPRSCGAWTLSRSPPRCWRRWIPPWAAKWLWI